MFEIIANNELGYIKYNKIIIVGPSTLPFLLKAVENMWRVDKQSKTIKDIASAASDIYDKTVSVYESFVKANQSLDLAKIKMDEAKLRLQDGSGSLTKKVEKMKNETVKKPIKTWSRKSTIIPDFVGVSFLIYNGKKFIPITISEDMVGHKMGEFAPTRQFFGHTPADKKAKVEGGADKK